MDKVEKKDLTYTPVVLIKRGLVQYVLWVANLLLYGIRLK